MIPVFLAGQYVCATGIGHAGFSAGVCGISAEAHCQFTYGVPNMDVLIFIGSTAAFVYSLAGTILQLGHDYMF